MDFAYPLCGFLVGALVGFTGIGGGSVMTPLLILVFGVHPLSSDRYHRAALFVSAAFHSPPCRLRYRTRGAVDAPCRQRPLADGGCELGDPRLAADRVHPGHRYRQLLRPARAGTRFKADPWCGSHSRRSSYGSILIVSACCTSPFASSQSLASYASQRLSRDDLHRIPVLLVCYQDLPSRAIKGEPLAAAFPDAL